MPKSAWLPAACFTEVAGAGEGSSVANWPLMELTLPDHTGTPVQVLPPPPGTGLTVLTSFRGHW